MKQPYKPTARLTVAALTGVMFAAYAAYSVFILIRDARHLSSTARVISAAVAIVFAVFALFAWTCNLKPETIHILIVRRIAFVAGLVIVFLLKLRMITKVSAYLDFSQFHTVLYACAYLLTQVAIALLLIYYAFILPKLAVYPKAAVQLPMIALILFVLSMILEALLLFIYGIGTETSYLRSAVSRPLFFLGFIGLSAYFLLPPEPTPTA